MPALGGCDAWCIEALGEGRVVTSSPQGVGRAWHPPAPQSALGPTDSCWGLIGHFGWLGAVWLGLVPLMHGTC